MESFLNSPSLTSQQVENLVHDINEPRESWFHRWFPYLRWSPSSPEKLKSAEEDLMNYVQAKSEGRYVEVNFGTNDKCRIWTRVFNPDAKDKLPLVMIHGMGAGLALFAMNFDELSKNRTVYAIDLPGYARSSRCKFSSKPQEVEDQYVQAIEEWRQKVGVGKFCLLGHSFGGYLSSAYALKHPDQLGHLILADPWGLPEQPKEVTRQVPIWVKVLYHTIFKHLNPLAGLRLAGPWGLNAITRLRPDLIGKFSELFPTEEENRRVIPAYLFHCNAHHPSGEAAFHTLMKGFAWAKNPMLPRLADLDINIPVTALYGEESWIKPISEEELMKIRPNGVYTKSRLIEDAGHHVYANAKVFNSRVLEACNMSDKVIKE